MKVKDLNKNWFWPLLALLLMWPVEWLQCYQRRTVLALFRLLCLKLLSIHIPSLQHKYKSAENNTCRNEQRKKSVVNLKLFAN